MKTVKFNYRIFIAIIISLFFCISNYARAERLENKIEKMKNIRGRIDELRGKQDVLATIGDRYKRCYKEYKDYEKQYLSYRDSYYHFRRRYIENDEEYQQIVELRKKSGFFKFLLFHPGKVFKKPYLEMRRKYFNMQKKYYQKKMYAARHKMIEKEDKMIEDVSVTYHLLPDKLKEKLDQAEDYTDGIAIIDTAIDSLTAEDKKLSDELNSIAESLSDEEEKRAMQEVFPDYSVYSYTLKDIISMVRGEPVRVRLYTKKKEMSAARKPFLDKEQSGEREGYNDEAAPEFVKQTRKSDYDKPESNKVNDEVSSRPQFVQRSQSRQNDDYRDDYRIVAISVETVPVRYNNTTLQKLRNLDTVGIIIRIRGEQHIIDGKGAVAILVEKGYFRNFPGVGLVATTKYDNFDIYSTDSGSSSDASRYKTIFNADDGCEGLRECYRKWGRELDILKDKDPKTARKILKNMEPGEWWERTSCATLEKRCKAALHSKGRQIIEDFDSRVKTQKMSPEAAKIFGQGLLGGD